MAHLEERLGRSVVVRSDDIDGNDVIGVAEAADGRRWQFVAHCDDDGRVLGSEAHPLPD